MVTRTDYTGDAVQAARSVLLEVTRLLGAYRDRLVLVGGWVPGLLLPDAEPRHVGSLDIDLALDHRRLGEPEYRTIRELLAGRGYEQDDRQPFIFRRCVTIHGREIRVEVDLLAGEYEGTGKSRRTQKVHDVRPRKARGCDLAFDMAAEVELHGTLPNGASDSAKIRIATIVPFLVMKGMALADRLKEKDAYDIHFCIKRYPGGMDALVTAFEPHVTHGLVAEGLAKIAGKFADLGGFGPTAVAGFEEAQDPDDRALIQRDAYEQASTLLRRLGVTPAKT